MLQRELAKRYPDAALIKDLAERGVLKTESPPARKVTLPVSLHQGEMDALRLTMSMKNSVLATDDEKAIKAARFLKVPAGAWDET